MQGWETIVYQMLRLISRLDIKGENVVKGMQFDGLRIVGKPGEMAQRYYEGGADELIFMDIVASLYGRNTILSTVSEVCKRAFIPLTVGCGLRSTECIIDCLKYGADKVALNTAAVRNPEFIAEAANIFGSQSIVINIEAKRRGNKSWEALTNSGREVTGRNVIDWAKEAQERGAGEILVTSIDKDGTRKGPDLALLREILPVVKIPVIVGGGIGSAADIGSLLDEGVEAVTLSALTHFGTETISSLKNQLSIKGYRTRPKA